MFAAMDLKLREVGRGPLNLKSSQSLGMKSSEYSGLCRESFYRPGHWLIIISVVTLPSPRGATVFIR